MDEVMFSKVCGLDVHENSVVACAVTGDGKRPQKTTRTFTAMRADLLALREWLKSLGVTTVVMEGTGVYWRCVYEVLEDAFDVWVVNARHVKKVPGRKSDVIDAEWLAKLLRSGLLRKSFVPQRDVRELRDLVRYRKMLVQAQTAEKNRIIKILEVSGIKLSAVASDVFGKSGRAMLDAIVEGTATPEAIAGLAKGKLRQKKSDLILALDTVVQPHHRGMLKMELRRLDATVDQIAEYDALIDAAVAKHQRIIELLQTIPGVKRVGAISIFAEVGPDLSAFERPENFCAWAGTCPGLHESAGKAKQTRHRKGNPHLCGILIECALAAARTKDTYLADKNRRLKARKPPMKAAFAIANKIAKAVYFILKTGEPYRELGPTYLDNLNRQATLKATLKRLTALQPTAEELRRVLAAIGATA